jgi:5-methylthioadenosine/S-adenosylhomocysteine deaminase
VTTNETLLLRNGIVLTMDPAIGDLDRGDVLVKDGVIAQVGRDLDLDAEIIDCAGHIVLPGFVNSHQHLFQTALRSYWADALEIDYFTQSRTGSNAIFHHYTPDDVYWGYYVGALENLAAGTTTVVDTSQCSYTPAHTDAALDALGRSGIRCVFSLCPATGDFEPAPSYNYPGDIHRLIDSGVHGERIQLALGYIADSEVFQLGRELGLPLFAHVNGPWLGQALEALDPKRLLGPWNTYIHCNGLDDSTWQVIERTGGKVSVSCHVEQSLGMGTPALQTAIDRGVAVGFGADAVSLGPVDFFSQMRAAHITQRIGLLQADRLASAERFGAGSTRDILRMATLGGAQAAHVEHLVGSLAPGKRADIVVLNARTLNAAPLTHATGAVVQLMDTSNVVTVIVDGQIMKKDGHLVGVDVPEAIKQLSRSAEGLLRRSNYPNILLTSCR